MTHNSLKSRECKWLVECLGLLLNVVIVDKHYHIYLLFLTFIVKNCFHLFSIRNCNKNFIYAFRRQIIEFSAIYQHSFPTLYTTSFDEIFVTGTTSSATAQQKKTKLEVFRKKCRYSVVQRLSTKMSVSNNVLDNSSSVFLTFCQEAFWYLRNGLHLITSQWIVFDVCTSP